MKQRNCPFFNSGYLNLTDIQDFCHSLLGQAVKIPQFHHGTFPLRQFGNGLSQGYFFQHLIFRFCVSQNIFQGKALFPIFLLNGFR